jgi:cobalt/nickel transport system permease protein
MYLDRLELKQDPLRSFDGRCRLLTAALVIAAAVGAGNTILLCALVLAGLCAVPGELSVTLRRLIPVNAMVLALWLPVLLGFSPGSALIYTLRVNAAALAYMRFVAPLGISAIASSLSALRLPEKLVSLFVLTYRYIFLLSDGLATTLAAMRSRIPENTQGRQWRSLAAVFAATLTRAALRSEKAGMAMTNRGFEGGFPPTVSFAWKLRDTLLLAAGAVLFAGVLWLG